MMMGMGMEIMVSMDLFSINLMGEGTIRKMRNKNI
jgi:hypothetical protein